MPRVAVTSSLSLDESELCERFVRASGPGGQNVNKVATAVELRFDALGSPSLPEPVKRRLLRLAGGRATQAGEIVIMADSFRSQLQNRAEARIRLFALIREAEPAPKRRRATRPSLAAKTRRLEGKAVRATVKAGRRKPDVDF